MLSMNVIRKGAWSKQEDDLLRQFVEKHGEGKWHQVPTKTGLRRCRRSCRLRWVNYLKPTIKREDFEEDEIDLMIRLQKLLGNRWSLIAGRLPGRTANHVKNYWYIHHKKKTASDEEKLKNKTRKTTYSTTIVRPRPRTLFKSLSCLRGKAAALQDTQSADNCSKSLTTPSPPIQDEADWWKALLDDTGDVVRTCSSLNLEEDFFTNFCIEDMA